VTVMELWTAIRVDCADGEFPSAPSVPPLRPSKEPCVLPRGAFHLRNVNANAEEADL